MLLVGWVTGQLGWATGVRGQLCTCSDQSSASLIQSCLSCLLQRPMTIKDHMYDSQIVDIKFHALPGGGGGSAGRHVISSDRHIVKVGTCLRVLLRGWLVGRGCSHSVLKLLLSIALSVLVAA